jgi:(p)ppGpp synthase/HD superfamily hydrolase
MTDAVLLVTRAFTFAAERHAHQRRKGADREPYINHLAEVADLVATATGGADPVLVVAAILHDSIEDTATTYDEIQTRFGRAVADLVLAVTDDKRLPKQERKRLQIAKAANGSTGAKIIKLADKTSNLRSLAGSPPLDWGGRRRAEYIRWSREVCQGLRGINAWLEGQFDAAAATAEAAIAAPSPGAP